MSNSAGVSITGTQTITSLLNFNNGNITTTNALAKLIVASSASVQNNSGTEWYVNGNLQMNYGSGTGTKHTGSAMRLDTGRWM